MRYIFAAAAMFLAAGSAIAGEANADLMDRIERVVELPASAAPLNEYRRYYSWANKGRTVLALYAVDDSPGRTWLPRSKMPIIIDEACKVIVFDFDVVANAPVNLTC